MKIEDKIILYLDNQLKEDVKIDFEKEIKQSSELQSKVEEYKSILGKIDLQDEPKLDQNYFSQLIPRFRKNIEKDESGKYIPAYAFSFAVMMLVVIFSYILFIDGQEESFDYTELNKIEIDDVESYYSGYYNPAEAGYYDLADEIPDSVIENQINKELEFRNEDTEYFYSYYSEYDDLLTEVTEQEAENVYQELLNRNYF